MPASFNTVTVFGSRFRRSKTSTSTRKGVFTHSLFILTVGVDFVPNLKENEDARSFLTELAFIPHISPPLAALANFDNRDRLPRNVSLSSISL